MLPPVMVLVGDIPVDRVALARQWTQALADAIDVPVEWGRVDTAQVAAALTEANVRLTSSAVEPTPTIAAPSSAFVLRDDGRPDWGTMTRVLDALALFGGRPAAPGGSAVCHTKDQRQLADDYDPVSEMRRGIFEATGLYSEPSAEGGWLDVTCVSRKMAAWMAAALALENVEARFDDQRLLVPASPMFLLDGEVSAVVVAITKAHRYWAQNDTGPTSME